MPRKSNRLAAADRRRQILAVATHLFARQGFRGTTTRQIAERARVNEAIVFRHFPHKDDLYWAILDGKCRSAGGRQQLEAELRAGADEEETFAAIAEGILQRNTKDTSLTRLLLFSALEHHRLSHRFFRRHVAGYYEALADHIRRRIRAGKMRRIDPRLAARGFLGMVVYHFLIQELFGGRRYQKFDTRQVCRTLAQIWLAGMRPLQKQPGRRRRFQAVATLAAERNRDFRARRASIREGG
ncbi:MAG: TetR/AcrR family transcriptional regulator [Candidatus Acidiferrales bacterium]